MLYAIYEFLFETLESYHRVQTPLTYFALLLMFLGSILQKGNVFLSTNESRAGLDKAKVLRVWC